MEKNLVVYKAYFEHEKEKCYIGITNNIKQRKSQHIRKAKNGKNGKFYDAIRKNGIPVFVIIKECLDINELLQEERNFIKEFNSKENGYNQTLGGQGTYGFLRPKSEEWKKRQSERMKGEKNSLYGKKFNTDQKNNHSKKMKDFYLKNPSSKAWKNKSCMGLFWINDGIIEKKIKKEEIIPENFVCGRLYKKRKSRKKTT